MKKSLLALLSGLLLTGTASAFDAVKAPIAAKQASSIRHEAARVATEDGYDLQFCDDLYTWYLFMQEDKVTYRCYIHIPAEIATELAGNELTSISFSSAVAAQRSGKIFVSEDLDADPVTSTAVKIQNAYAMGEPYYQTANLETPYTIKENTGFYFGYIVSKCRYTSTAMDYPVGIDGMPANEFCGTVEMTTTSGETEIIPMNEFGSNLILKATTVGEKHTMSNVFSVQDISVGNVTLPVVTTEGANAVATIANYGSNELTTLSYSVSLNGGDAMIRDIDISVAGNTTGTVNLALPTLELGRGNVEIKINSINGKIAMLDCESEYIAVKDGYPRKFVVEEGTGTWCKYCPIGIVGFEYMEKNYPDSFIGIAVHGGDTMEVECYNSLLAYFDGFPECVVNRDPAYLLSPSSYELSAAYSIWNAQKGAVNVSGLKADRSYDVLNVDADITFGFNDDKNEYLMAFVVLESGYVALQQNYFSGGASGTCGGWENYSNPYPWTYTHVARNIVDVFGIKSKPMTDVKENGTVNFSAEVPLANVADVEKTSLVALVLDKNTGIILNAAKIEASDYTASGVENIAADSNAPVEYFNLQGLRMNSDNLPSGIYIMRQGNKVVKIVK